MRLKEITIEGFKSFARKTQLVFPSQITGIVGPNGSGKSNVTEAFRFVLGEQSMKNMRGRRGEDLIFNGGAGSSSSSRASVNLIFDNKNHVLHDSFDEVNISRTVYRDGSNIYEINGTQVRQRDIIEMLSQAHIGTTGHHIISQGQADSILHATSEVRKEMIEDGLGLKLLQYRRRETEKKIKKCHENLREVSIVIRELTPQSTYLKKQVEKFEQSRELQETLQKLYAEYLSNEVYYIHTSQERLDATHKEILDTIKKFDIQIREEEKRTDVKIPEEFTNQLQTLHIEAEKLREEKGIVARELGRTEGEITALSSASSAQQDQQIHKKHIQKIYTFIEKNYTSDTDADSYKKIVQYVLTELKSLLFSKESVLDPSEEQLKGLHTQQESLELKIKDLGQQEDKIAITQQEITKKQSEFIKESQHVDKKMFQLIEKKNECMQQLSEVRHALQTLSEDKKELSREVQEGTVLIGRHINDYKTLQVEVPIAGNRDQQKERRRVLEKTKINLEALGTGAGEEVYKEYTNISERLEFLYKEKEDILDSISNCEEALTSLQEEIESQFSDGIQKISIEFQRFFKILFGGGKASISIEKILPPQKKEEEDAEQEVRLGVSIHTSLPHKKVTSPDQLSGGERALVSIALLFAISQVTPPPFLILDETDAALDEANSRRYGDMIEELAKHSQLIVVTHNRETMHSAHTLYGVTMNTNGISALLSIQFDEAVKVAK